MKNLLSSIIIVSSSLTISCTGEEGKVESASLLVQETTIAKNVSPEDFQNLISTKKNAIILDVRTQKEVDEGHLINSTHLDFYTPEFKTNLSKLDKTKPIMVYCHSGHRSGLTMTALKEMGFSEVYNLATGIVGWKQAGLPIEK